MKAAIEIHKLEVEALKAESLAEAAEKETHQWVHTIVTKGWSSTIFVLLGVKKDVLSEEFSANRIFIPGFLLMGIERTLAGWQAT